LLQLLIAVDQEWARVREREREWERWVEFRWW